MTFAWVDLGDGVSVARIADGLLWRHGCTADPRGPESGGDSIPFTPPWPEAWTVEHDDPLTITPSVLCTACGRHGFIRAGRWVPA